MVESIPVDYDDFVRRYRGDFLGAGVSTREVEKVAFTLWVDYGLKDFRPEKPTSVTCEEVLAYLGIPFTTWRSFVMGCRSGSRQHSNFVPTVVEGGTLCQGPYVFVDIERIFTFRHLCFPKYAQTPKAWTKRTFAESVVPKPKFTFREVFHKALDKHMYDPRELLFEVPEHLPQNNEQLYATYRTLVATVVFQRIKFGIHPEDAQSEVWTKLLSSDLIHKFVQSGIERLPVTMTSDEAKDFLGISDSAWNHMMRTYSKAPTPVKGDYRDPDTRFITKDILKLDDSKFFRRRPFPRRHPPDAVSKQRLDGYVRVAAVRAILNLFRHLDRHSNPEKVQPEGICLIQKTCGSHHAVHLEDPVAWEANLPSHAPQQDESYDAYRLASALGVEFGTPEYYSAIRSVVERAEKRGINFHDFSPEVGLSMVTSLVEGTSLAGDAQYALVQMRQKQVCRQA